MTIAGRAAGEELMPRAKPCWNAKIQELLPFSSSSVWEQLQGAHKRMLSPGDPPAYPRSSSQLGMWLSWHVLGTQLCPWAIPPQDIKDCGHYGMPRKGCHFCSHQAKQQEWLE